MFTIYIVESALRVSFVLFGAAMGRILKFLCDLARFTSRNSSRYASRGLSTQAMPQVDTPSVHTTRKGICYEVRSLTPKDLPQLFQIRRELGIYNVASCYEYFLRLDPNGIKAAVTETDEILGTCTAVNIEDREDGVCFGAGYYVKPKYQSQGIGSKLWKSCLKHIGARNAGLNVLDSQLELYRNGGGFPIHETRFTNVEYQARSSHLDFSSLSDVPPPGVTIQPFLECHLPSIFAYDHNLSGLKRSAVLEIDCAQQACRTVVSFRESACVGFGSVRLDFLGLMWVGPLYADDPQTAEVMLRKLVGLFPEAQSFACQSVNTNLHARELMRRIGCGTLRESHRLYTKERLEVDLSKVFFCSDSNFSPF